jgi:protein-S-isoprenylcysteine O-methyltransferase Ste14
MADETVYRWLLGAIMVIGVTLSKVLRARSDRTACRVSRRVDGTPILVGLALGALGAFGGLFAYLLNPDWMAWSQLDLPAWARLAGGLLGVAALVLFTQVFGALGANATPTSATREQHTLVTDGPYRLVRHPMYLAGAMLFSAYALISANWFVAACTALCLGVLFIRTRREEANLIDRFGDDYRAYMQRTGRFLPRF